MNIGVSWWTINTARAPNSASVGRMLASPSSGDRAKRRAPSASQAQSQPQPQPQRQHSNPGPDPAGAGRFIGGVVGGMLR